ncbi:ribonuclease III family protein [bacterium]|nr:ribonuclease III family protein [bacterium]
MSLNLCAASIRDWVSKLDENRLRKHFPDVDARIAALERLQRHTYASKQLAMVALIHRSALVYWPTDKTNVFSNERLEFLGDSFLNFFVASESMSGFESMSEGQLSKLRAALVSTENLADKARHLNLNNLLMFGRGEIAKGGFRDDKRQNILADAFEAVTAALLLDAGEQLAWEWLASLFAVDFVTAQQTLDDFDVKTRFQQWSQAICGKPPTYKLVKTISTPQETQFVVAGYFGRTEISRASASNKRDASKLVAARMQKLVDSGQLTEDMVKRYASEPDAPEVD